MKEMQKTYQPQAFEKDLYHWWEEQGFFRAEAEETKKPYTILMPPPNITGQLHMGHALDNSVQDCLIRFKRMQGYAALWLPGTDHASIATEVKVIEDLKRRGIEKSSLTREQFLEYCWQWKEKYGGRIVEQLKSLGASCDWSRLAFTLDEQRSKAVRHVFVKLYQKGLIYQGNRITNWCPHCKTALSDAEVEYAEQDSHLWYCFYRSKEGDFTLTFATTRPETMLGDVALAVNPQDERYSAWIGRTVIVPFVNREIPVIADEYVEKDFGTGVVKITPAHDPNDFEVGKRHDLPVIRILDDTGHISNSCPMFDGMDRYEARKAVVEEMRKLGQLVKIEDYKHNVGECYRCHTTVEPMVSKQWYVKMEELAKEAIRVVKDGSLRFIPKHFEKTYFNWMENIKDWCISRQLWWGHRIPVYYCDDCGEVICSEEQPSACPKCGGKLRQDEDVLDTWFSSALWPFSTLGYPEKTKDLQYFFPTNVLVTAYDIIFFWVARMIFSSLEHMGEIPFRDVLIHGIVRDAQGRKMSKSLGNGIDPLEIVEKSGADSLRFALLSGVSNGSDIRFSQDKLDGMSRFMNKIWNASRFVWMNSAGVEVPEVDFSKLNSADRFILHRLNETVRSVTEQMEKYELGLASQQIYDFLWSEFCDWYIEFSKPVLYGEDEAEKKNNLAVLQYVLKQTLELLHPFAPFITEEIYQQFGFGKTIMLESFPVWREDLCFAEDARWMETVKELVSKIRNTRVEMNVPASKKVHLLVKTLNEREIRSVEKYLQKLAGIESVSFVPESPEKSVAILFAGGEAFLPLGELVDVQKETVRLQKELDSVLKDVAFVQNKLNNAGFVAKAPQQLVAAEREKLGVLQEKAQQLQVRLEDLQRI